MMSTEQEIIGISNQLAQAVETALNPQIPQSKRHEAYNACEEFKEYSPYCIQCSIYLAMHGSDLVRHFGLQLMEYCVRYKWYQIDQAQKLSIKNVTTSLLESCEGEFSQHVHLRDALSRVIVEMVKREWPQQWPNLLPELYEVAAKGHVQAEAVLLIFLRLIEDVVVLQTVEYAQRRKDLYQHLVLQAENIFTFLLNLMAQHYVLNVPESVRVINVSLKLLSEIIEFAFINRIVAEESRLIPVLCGFLSNENFQLETAECLCRIATKKGKFEEKKVISTVLLNSTLLSDIVRLNLLLQNGTLNEQNYLFVKKISELLNALCALLCIVIKSEADKIYDYMKEENFLLLLEMMITLCNHPSYVVSFNINTAWTAFFKHGFINKDRTFLDYAAKWVMNVTPKLIKIQYNPEHVIPLFQECYKYMIFDFDSEDSFTAFYARVRAELQEGFRHLTTIAPLVTFSAAEQWLVNRAQTTSTLSANFPAHLEDIVEWEGLNNFYNTVIFSLPTSHGISLDRSLQLLNICLDLKPADPDVLNHILSIISVLIFFVNSASKETQANYMPRILDKIFSCLLYELPGQTKGTRTKNVRSLRKHATCLLVKSSQHYPRLFLPFFDTLKNVFTDLQKDTNQLCKLEVTTFLEAMLLIDNAFCDYEKQTKFIGEMYTEIKEYWMKISADVIGDHGKLAAFVGLDTKPPYDTDVFYKNRGLLSYCVDIVLAIVKRSSWPDAKEATSGGFLVGYDGDYPIYKNPATPHILEALPGVFSLIKCIHALWTGEAKSKLPPEYEKVHELTDMEIKMLLGGHIRLQEMQNMMYEIDTDVDTSYLTKTQNYLIALYENSFLVLTKSCQSLRYHFYELPNFVPSFAASIFSNLDAIPDYRLRVMIKGFLKSLIINCPPTKYEAILLPIFGYFTSYMYERLSNKWKYLKECRESGKLKDDDNEDSKEMLEDLLNTQLSREYMDIVKTLLLKTNAADLKQCNGASSVGEESTSPMGSQNNLSISTNIYDFLSDLGVKFLRMEKSNYTIMNFLLTTITWLDSTNSLRATFMVGTVVKQLAADGNINQELAVQTLIYLLQGLQLHGQHDANQGSLLNCAVQIYQLLRQQFPQLKEIMSMVPGINMDDLQKFDQKMMTVVTQNKIEKGTKEMFKKLVSNLIGQNIGQLFKRRETIRDLPKIEIVRPKGENILNLSGNENDIGIANFFK